MKIPNKLLNIIVNNAKNYIPRGEIAYLRCRDSYLSLSFVSHTFAYKTRKALEISAENFGAYINFDLLKNALRSLKGEDSDIEITSNFLTIKNSSSIFKLNTMSGGLSLPKIDFINSFQPENSAILNNSIKRFRYFAPVDDLFTFSCVNITPKNGNTICWVTDGIGVFGETLELKIPKAFTIPGKWAVNLLEVNKIEFAENWMKYSNNEEALLVRSQIADNKKMLDLIDENCGLQFDKPTIVLSKENIIPFLENNKSLFKESYGLTINLIPPTNIKLYLETEIYSAEFVTNSIIEFITETNFTINPEYLLKMLSSIEGNDMEFDIRERYFKARSAANDFYFLPYYKKEGEA